MSSRETKDWNRFGREVNKALRDVVKRVNMLAEICVELAERVEELEEYVAGPESEHRDT